MTELIHPCGAVDLSNGRAPPSGRNRLPTRCFWSDARLRNVPNCLPKVTHSSAIMRYSLHRERLHSSFSPPMANHCSAPFSMRRIRDISSLTPRIQFCGTQWERFCRGSEVESGIFHCAGPGCHPPGSGVRRGVGRGEYSRRACRFSGLATTV